MGDRRVSIVMCTYNGERFVRQQIDSLLAQTYPLSEIIIQDDGSTDGTLAILGEYASAHENIHVYRNDGPHGINQNFFSAMRKATGELIAICDQDDIWEPTKIEKQVAAIGDRLLCVCRTKPFSDDGAAVGWDERTPCYAMMRLLYTSIAGHTMLLNRRLLTLLPPLEDDCYHTLYDVVLSTTAGAYQSLVLVDEVLVHQRRYAAASTFVTVDHHREPSAGNALYIIRWSLTHWHRIRPRMKVYFSHRLRMVEAIGADNDDYRDALKALQLHSRYGSTWRLLPLYVRHRHHLFYTEQQGAVNFMRALLYPLMITYNYRFLLR